MHFWNFMQIISIENEAMLLIASRLKSENVFSWQHNHMNDLRKGKSAFVVGGLEAHLLRSH